MTGLLPEGGENECAKKQGSEVFWRFLFPPRLAGKRVFTPFRLFPIAVFYFLLPS
jgi:hypothetical protein